jgi:hypothetical protein
MNFRPIDRSTIAEQYNLFCAVCSEQFSDDWLGTKREVIDGARECGWKNTRKLGWVCGECLEE